MNDAVHPTPWHCGPGYTLYHDDCMSILPRLPAASVDAVVCDPIYPGIDRHYGRITEGRWMAMMKMIVGDIRRLLKPSGSAAFVIQPNSARVGRMRTWVWDFQAWIGREWGIVQDAYWWNISSPPTVHCNRTNGLMRGSVKMVVWAGGPKCYRDQDAVLWEESQGNAAKRLASRALSRHPSGYSMRSQRCAEAALDRGGVTPFNLLPIANADSRNSAGASGHGAGTPYDLCDWWVRYISPPGGVVLDPFTGSSTVGLAALANGRTFIGIDRDVFSMECSKQRLQSPEAA